MMAFLLALLFIACAVLGVYLVVDALLPVDPDLERARGGRSFETTCGLAGCATHRIAR